MLVGGKCGRMIEGKVGVGVWEKWDNEREEGWSWWVGIVE